MKKYINTTVVAVVVIGLLSLVSFKGKEEIGVSKAGPVYEFKILAKSENEYITLFEVDGQRFVYIYEGSLQKLD